MRGSFAPDCATRTPCVAHREAGQRPHGFRKISLNRYTVSTWSVPALLSAPLSSTWIARLSIGAVTHFIDPLLRQGELLRFSGDPPMTSLR
jgi:hypothetical protein